MYICSKDAIRIDKEKRSSIMKQFMSVTIIWSLVCGQNKRKCRTPSRSELPQVRETQQGQRTSPGKEKQNEEKKNTMFIYINDQTNGYNGD